MSDDVEDNALRLSFLLTGFSAQKSDFCTASKAKEDKIHFINSALDILHLIANNNRFLSQEKAFTLSEETMVVFSKRLDESMEHLKVDKQT